MGILCNSFCVEYLNFIFINIYKFYKMKKRNLVDVKNSKKWHFIRKEGKKVERVIRMIDVYKGAFGIIRGIQEETGKISSIGYDSNNGLRLRSDVDYVKIHTSKWAKLSKDSIVCLDSCTELPLEKLDKLHDTPSKLVILDEKNKICALKRDDFFDEGARYIVEISKFLGLPVKYERYKRSDTKASIEQLVIGAKSKTILYRGIWIVFRYGTFESMTNRLYEKRKEYIEKGPYIPKEDRVQEEEEVNFEATQVKDLKHETLRYLSLKINKDISVTYSESSKHIFVTNELGMPIKAGYDDYIVLSEGKITVCEMKQFKSLYTQDND